MRVTDALGFAMRALRGHRLRTGLSLLGVAVGVAAVIMLTALGEAARRYVVGQFESIGSNLLIIVPGKTETTGAMPFAGATTRDLTLGDAEAVRRRVREAARVAPIVLGTETVAHAERRRQVSVVGATSDFLTVRRLTLARGTDLPPGDVRQSPAVALIGATVARELFPGTDPLGRVIRIGDQRARVIGILAPRGTQLGLDLNEIVVIPVHRAMRLFNRRSLFRLMISVRAHADLDAAKRSVVSVLTERHGEEDVTAITQDAVVASFSRILTALTMALAAIAAVSLAVAGLGIMNVMLVTVAERTSEVGLLRAVGAGRGQVLGVFLAEAALLSLTGGLAGLAAGVVGVWLLVRAFPAFPAEPPLWAVAASLTLSLVAGIVFGLLPARRAADLDPVRALGGR
jgi:putative ABC transport system permease protein